MTEFDYLEYEFYDAQARWRIASIEEREILRDHVSRLARRADLEQTADGLRLADAMRRLVAAIEEQLRLSRPLTSVPEDFQVLSITSTRTGAAGTTQRDVACWPS